MTTEIFIGSIDYTERIFNGLALGPLADTGGMCRGDRGESRELMHCSHGVLAGVSERLGRGRVTASMQSLRSVIGVLLGLALLAGPAGAACKTCCPQAPAETTLATPPSCCGDCSPTLEKSPEPAARAGKSTAAEGNLSVAALALLTRPVPARCSSSDAVLVVSSLVEGPPPASTPLRL